MSVPPVSSLNRRNTAQALFQPVFCEAVVSSRASPFVRNRGSPSVIRVLFCAATVAVFPSNATSCIYDL